MTEKQRRRRQARPRTSKGPEVYDSVARSSKPAEPVVPSVENALAERREVSEESPIPAIGTVSGEIVEPEKRLPMEQESPVPVIGTVGREIVEPERRSYMEQE